MFLDVIGVIKDRMDVRSETDLSNETHTYLDIVITECV